MSDVPAEVIRPDNRLNADPVAPVVIYCEDYGIDIYARDASDTYQFALRALAADYEALGTPAANTLLATSADGNVRLFLLTTGEFQVNATFGNEEYVAIWTGCPASGWTSPSTTAPRASCWPRATSSLGCRARPPSRRLRQASLVEVARSNRQAIDILSGAAPYAASLFDSPHTGGDPTASRISQFL